MRVLVVGGCLLDVSARPTAAVVSDTSNEAEIAWSPGGAGRNVAENLARLGFDVTLITDLADDVLGRVLLAHMADVGVEVRLARRQRTGVYLAVLHRDGSLDRGLCQTATEEITCDDVLAVLPDLTSFDGAVLDANLAAATLAALAARLRLAAIPFALEPVAQERSRRVLAALPRCALVKPDRLEAARLTGLQCLTREDAAGCAAVLHRMGARAVIVSLGPDGLVFQNDVEVRCLDASPTTLVNVTGAGDALLATAFAGLLRGMPADRYLEAARRAAALTCACPTAVSPAMGPGLLDAEGA